MTKLDANAIRAVSIYRLATYADCASPDSNESPGAKFLDRVRDDLADAIDYNDGDFDTEDGFHEIADGCVPVYTHPMWQTFVDLAAYNEDASELGADASDMTKAAMVCLYMIAERLCHALADDFPLDEDADEDDAE